MSSVARQQEVFDILRHFDGMEPLKELFYSKLSYERVAESLSRRGWTDTTSKALAEDPLLLAAGGAGKDFHVIYSRLDSEKLLLGSERPVVTKLLSEHPYSLFIFSNADRSRWHFVNVKHDDDLERRRLFRRITIGREERLRTASERIAMLDLERISDQTPLAIQAKHEDAFDKGRVTEQFYKDYVAALNAMEQSIKGLRDTTEEAHARRDYAQLVLGRLMFLYFLQMKGWLGEAGKTSANQGRLESDHEYLERHFKRITSAARGKATSTAFYDDFLTGLFFKVLNTPRRDRKPQVTREYGEIPFLNGGLFHRTTAELYGRDSLHIPDETFRLLFENEKSLFLKYNFTVKEDDPFDVSVAVDPEMLGMVFERQVLEREVKGAFYTPPSGVDLMCQRALVEYLCVEFPQIKGAIVRLLETEQAEGLAKEEAVMVFDRLWNLTVCDAGAGSGAFLMGMLHRLVRLHYALYSAHPHIAAVMSRRLEQVAPRNYFMGHEWTEPQVKYLLKRHIIRTNLFGVDIEPSAIQIAKLRMWLSLCVEHDAEFVDHIPPLPNLEYNVRVGNSLSGNFLGIDFELETDSRSKRLEAILRELDRLEASYYELTDERAKSDCRDEIEDAEWRLLEEGVRDDLAKLPEKKRAVERALAKRKAESLFPEMVDYTEDELSEMNWLDERAVELAAGLEKLRTTSAAVRRKEMGKHPVLWQVHFPRVFRDRGGFDIAIMNPPYVSMQGASELPYVPALVEKLGFNADFYAFFRLLAV